MYALVGYTPDLLLQLCIQIAETARFTPLQATQKVPPQVTSLRTPPCPWSGHERPAQPRRKTIRPQPHRLHVVVENFFRHPANLLKSSFVQARSSVPNFWSSAASATILRLYPRVNVKLCSFRSWPPISSVPRCPQSTCACFPVGVSNRRTATVRADYNYGE